MKIVAIAYDLKKTNYLHMKYTKIFQYAYIAFAAVFAFEAISKYKTKEVIDYPSIVLALLALFMYFFRSRFNNKIDKSNSSN